MKDLLKRELKAVWKYWRIFAPSALLISAICGFISGFWYEEFDLQLLLFNHLIWLIPIVGFIYNIVSAMFNPVVWISSQISNLLPIILGCAVALIIFVKFYKELFTEKFYTAYPQGTSVKSAYSAKVFAALFWITHAVVLIALTFVIYLVCTACSSYRKFGPQALYPLYGEGAFFAPATWLLLGCALVWLSIVICFFVVLALWCITLGCNMAKRARIWIAIGLFCAIFFSVTPIIIGLSSIGAYFLSFYVYGIDLQFVIGISLFALEVIVMCAVGIILYKYGKKALKEPERTEAFFPYPAFTDDGVHTEKESVAAEL